MEHVNALTGRNFTGGNVNRLANAMETKGWRTPLWATYRQWQELKMQVRKGEKGTRIGVHAGNRRFATVFNVAQVDGQDDGPGETPAPSLPALPALEAAPEAVRASHALDVVSQAADRYDADQVYALFSGGHDSLASTLIAARHPKFKGVVHVNTGIGIEETRQFVRDTCRRYGWPLYELHPPRRTYRDMVLGGGEGFPGPSMHKWTYIWLKKDAIDKFVTSRKTHRLENVVLVSGQRTQESARRARHVQAHRKDKSKIWTNPIHDWSKGDCLDWIEHVGARQNRVVQLIHKSGECLCGAFARPGELAEIELWYPEAAEQIRALEAEARTAGLKRCQWGSKDGTTPNSEPPGPMCSDCVSAAPISDDTGSAEAEASNAVSLPKDHPLPDTLTDGHGIGRPKGKRNAFTLQSLKKGVSDGHGGPVYVARFADGTVKRMSFFQVRGKAWDFDRGRKVCAQAYEAAARWRQACQWNRPALAYPRTHADVPPMIDGHVVYAGETIPDPAFVASEAA